MPVKIDEPAAPDDHRPMSEHDPLVRALRFHAAACRALGSDFSGGMLERAADDAEAGGRTRNFFSPWDGAATRVLMEAAVALRFLGGLHDLVLSGDAPALAADYPGEGRPGGAGAAWPSALAAMDQHSERLAGFMTHEPQTNEVSRSACLLGAFLTVAKDTGLALRCLEVGASAGLNQLWDRYRYRLGETMTWGEAGASVVIAAEWRGPPPPLEAPIRVVERGACDRRPVDLADPAASRRLKAYVWADQIERLDRLAAAIAVARDAGTRVETEDAVSWTARRAAPRAGCATVLFHSVFWQYMPVESQSALRGVIGGLGASATDAAPVAWLRMEPLPTATPMEVRLTQWPGGRERLLAHAHPHGAWVEWLSRPDSG